MNWLALYIGAIGVYMLIVALCVDTSNLRSHIILRAIPITISMSLILIGLLKGGLLNLVASIPL